MKLITSQCFVIMKIHCVFCDEFNEYICLSPGSGRKVKISCGEKKEKEKEKEKERTGRRFAPSAGLGKQEGRGGVGG